MWVQTGLPVRVGWSEKVDNEECCPKFNLTTCTCITKFNTVYKFELEAEHNL